MDREILISIIIPVYNVERYLQQCLQSVLEQSYQNLEVVAIDDGSTDGGAGILDRFSIVDARCRVIHKENGGLSSARNKGIDLAHGDYIWFLDGDDYLTNDRVVQQVATILGESLPDMLIVSYQKYYERFGRYSKPRRYPYKTATKDQLLRDRVYQAMACNKIMKRTLLEEQNLSFLEGVINEDLPWCAKLLISTESIIVYNQSVFVYRQRMGSISNNEDDARKKTLIKDTIRNINGVLKWNLRGSERELLLKYLAYEYLWLLGVSYPYWECFGKDMESFIELLNYQVSSKGRIISALVKMIGIKGTAALLHRMIELKGMMV